MVNLENILLATMQETSTDEYQNQFVDIKCDDQYYYLYKHLSFDPNLYVLNLFRKLQLKFTHPDSFNDPYDCMASIEFDDIPQSNHEELQKRFSKSIKSNLSVTCFNNNPLNMLMWSHYAQSHTGFLVEFKIPHPTIEWVHTAFNVQPVKYQNEFPKLSLAMLNPSNFFDDAKVMLDFVTNQYLVKSKDWQYENEFRTLAHDYDPNNFNSLLKIIPPEYISSVILGAKLEEEDLNKKEIIAAISFFNKEFKQDVKVYQASLKLNSFRIVVKDHPILDRKTKTLKDFLFPTMG
ncbi:hypothetical protein F946_00715 [Acinetobacter johnsonii ANC 3681]|uniref:DUF2971 domain-containing protein n=1 Tax=Acinetobacter johnsonii ANC 3681 TaxID=1217662 RepID=N9CZP1_ACIJO|nr:DUF2971 domain-containing protein [Acinetobacter johnsonii]ENV73778.1 hypothetical protein F946_00715 [Acinetobacter johnsonii ANC 3681]MCS3526905.1 hypothetical protein [Acinetobacter johnsonii]